MIDTHCHLLFGVDDGPEEPEETMAMCRMAWDDGIRAVVATPHSLDGRFVNSPQTILEMVDQLNQDLAAQDLELRILPGMEARITADVLQHLAEGLMLPLNNRRHIILEFHPLHVPAGFENLIKGLLEAGYFPVLTHPEKNLAIQRNPAYVYRITQMFPPWSVLVQITADSLTGRVGFWARQTARLFLKCGLAHLIATDAHSPTTRPPRLGEAVRVASGIVGEARARKMVHDIPLAMLAGRKFPAPWPVKEPRSMMDFFR